MDTVKIGGLLKKLRLEKGLTQQKLADKMNISDKAISKWERGKGLPDISLLNELCDIFKVNIEKFLEGKIDDNKQTGGNMKKIKYYVCKSCGNISICTGDAEISCCGRKLEALIPQKATEAQKLSCEQIENDWYITSEHEMTKSNYISFIAFATGDKVEIIKQYPEWDLSVRIPQKGHGKLIWYSAEDGLFYQLL